MQTYSIIIPTLNEEIVLHRCLERILSIRPGVEIVVADGGSIDGTLKIALEMNAIICHSETGRARQLNAGASIASGNILVFLHADTELSQEAFNEMDTAFSNEEVKIAAFRLNFDVKNWLLNIFLRPSKFNIFLIFGDQCIATRKTFFNLIGGFPEIPLFEDLSFIFKARKTSAIHGFKSVAVTSARRHMRRGILKQQLLNAWYIVLFLLGMSPASLAKQYYRSSGLKDKKSAIGILLRNPESEKVKTRLVKDTGKVLAVRIYRLCATNMIRECVKLSGDTLKYIFFDNKENFKLFRRWVGRGFTYIEQDPGTMGQKLEHAISTMLSHGNQKAIVLASDIPDLSSDIILNAESLLDDNDIIIGPCRDGGYYLIGMKKMYYELFQNISWSTEKVFQETVTIAGKMGLSIGRLPELIDIDTIEDLLVYTIESHTELGKSLGNAVDRWRENV